MCYSRLRAVFPQLLMVGLGACSKSAVVVRSLDDATHAKIGVMTGTTGEAAAKARLPEATIKSFDDIMDAVTAMKSGQLDGIVTAYPTAVQVSKKNPDLGALSEALTNEDTSVAVRK